MDDKPLVLVLMGSDSDLATMSGATEVLESFGVPFEAHVMSAHRSPDAVAELARGARARGVRLIVAGAGMAAHLAGAVAAHTTLPVIGVPLAAPGALLGGADALYATVQMPPGIPVATVAINGARNAGHLAVRILALGDQALASAVEGHRRTMANETAEKDRRLQSLGVAGYLKGKSE